MNRFLLLLILALGFASCNKLRNWKYNPPNVLLISVEGLSRALPCYGDTVFQTPNIDRLAMRAVVFEQALAQHPTSLHALNSIYTGWYPRLTLTYPDDGPYLRSLFPGLGSGDYRISFPGLAAAFQKSEAPVAWLTDVQQAEAEPPRQAGNPGVTQQVVNILEKYEGDPFFINAYYRMKATQNTSSEAGYQEALTEVDQEIGQLLNELMSRQEASNTIVVLAGLNPMGVAPRNLSRNSFSPEFVKVPLLYYDFEQDSSRRVPHLTELRSLYPTLSKRCLEDGQEQPACNAPSIPQMLEGSFREMAYSEVGLCNDRRYFAAYTAEWFYLSEAGGVKELFSLSGTQAKLLPADSTLLDSLKHAFQQKYRLSAVD